MNCMKCGREIEAGQVFCSDCLADMEKYPVKPGTVVHIPSRPAESGKRAAGKKRGLTPEEQLPILKKRNRLLTIALAAALLLAITLGIVAGGAIDRLDVQKLIGKNYTTVVTGETGTSEGTAATD